MFLCKIDIQCKYYESVFHTYLQPNFLSKYLNTNLTISNNTSYINAYNNARRWNLWGGITCWHMWNTDIIIFIPSTQEEYINKLRWQCTWQSLLASAIYLHKNIPCKI